MRTCPLFRDLTIVDYHPGLCHVLLESAPEDRFQIIKTRTSVSSNVDFLTLFVLRSNHVLP
jgi:hypothetical protein